MEVASPLTFGHVQAGTKRRFACSPILDSSMGVESNAVSDFTMDECNPYGNAMKKRRRFGSSDSFEMNNQSAVSSPSPFAASFASPQSGGGHVTALGKRQRNDDCSHHASATSSAATAPASSQANTTFLQKVVEKQNAEIQSLREEKTQMQSTIHTLNESQERILHENKILKKAVTVQQQRQTHASNELEAARQYKEQAENKMRMLEQVISSLRYHLQAQQPHVGNDFMGLNQRPPDVF